MHEIRVLVTLQVDEADKDDPVAAEGMDDAAVNAVENAVRAAEGMASLTAWTTSCASVSSMPCCTRKRCDFTMKTENTNLTVEIQYNPAKTDAESLTSPWIGFWRRPFPRRASWKICQPQGG